LVEVLVSIVILTVGLLGMLQVINLAIKTNMQNQIRNEAVTIAEEQMAREKSLPFDNITASAGVEKSINVRVPIRSAFMNYSVTKRIDKVGNGKKVDIGVRWLLKGNKYEHVVSSIVTAPPTQ
jgi:type IV pilus assembly protein PilV